MSNLKQMGLGMMMYVQDYDETFPARYFSEPAATFWWQLLQPYTKSSQLFQCPSAPTVGATNGQYGANWLVINNAGSTKLAEMQSTATTYLMMDWGTYYVQPSFNLTGNSSWNYLPGMGQSGGICTIDAATYPDNVGDCASGRHFGGINMTFADGHVKWLKDSIVIQESAKCASNVCPTVKTAWNPLVDNS